MLPQARLELALTSDAKILLGSEEIPENQLTARLKQLKADKPDMGLELKADEKAPLKNLVDVWDALTQAGYPVKEVPARILVKKPKD